MKLKKGVKVMGIKPETLFAMVIANGVVENFWKDYEMTVTSVTDSTHGIGSKHYIGQAFDIRTKDMPEKGDIPALLKYLREYLGNGYDVVFEKDHIHIEFDPEIIN